MGKYLEKFTTGVLIIKLCLTVERRPIISKIYQFFHKEKIKHQIDLLQILMMEKLSL